MTIAEFSEEYSTNSSNTSTQPMHVSSLVNYTHGDLVTSQPTIVDRAILPEFNSMNNSLLNLTTQSTVIAPSINETAINFNASVQSNVTLNDEYLNSTTNEETRNITTTMALSNRTLTLSSSTVIPTSTTTTTRSTSSISVPIETTSVGTGSGKSFVFDDCQNLI